MVKLEILALGGLALLFLSRRQNAEQVGAVWNEDSPRGGEPIRATDEISALASPFLPILNTPETEALYGNLNPYTGGPQTMANPYAATADYAPWGGTIEQGGSLFAFINGVNTRNPSADLVFVRGEGVYR